MTEGIGFCAASWDQGISFKYPSLQIIWEALLYFGRIYLCKCLAYLKSARKLINVHGKAKKKNKEYKGIQTEKRKEDRKEKRKE